jgi:hypothetical protein
MPPQLFENFTTGVLKCPEERWAKGETYRCCVMIYLACHTDFKMFGCEFIKKGRGSDPWPYVLVGLAPSP